MMFIQQPLQTIVILIFSLSGVSAQDEKGEKDIDICQSVSEEKARLINLYSPTITDSPAGSLRCSCNVTSSSNLMLAVSIRYYLADYFTSLVVKYKRAEEYITWTGNSIDFSSHDKDGGGFFINNSISAVEVTYELKPDLKSSFALDIRAVNASDELKISCSQLPVTSDENTDDVIRVIEAYCSAYMLIVLACVCTAFFLAMICLACCLCCTVRKSKSQSSFTQPMEAYRVQSRIYDDGAALAINKP